MGPERRRSLALLVALILLLGTGLAGAELVYREETVTKRVVELSVNDTPLVARFPFALTSPLDRNFHYATGRHLLYAVPVLPGQFYSFGLTFPSFNQEVAVSIYDRWPWAPGARRAQLPFPAAIDPTGPFECLWRFGISPHSTGTRVYVVIEASSPLDRGRSYLPHTVFINNSADMHSRGALGENVHFMEGPRAFQAVGNTGQMGAGPVTAMEVPAYSAQRVPPELQDRPLPGDLLRNSRFRQGLSYWEPSQSAADSTTALAAVTADGLRLWSHEGRGRIRVTQQLAEDVRDASALFLRAQVKITRQTSPGLGAGREAPVAISVCYEDAEGKDHCGENAFWQGFYVLKPSEEIPDRGQQVSPGLWYHFVTDLIQLESRPAVIKSIALEGSGWPKWEGWVKEVHLLKRTGKEERAVEGSETFGRPYNR
ncbi:MAG: hypothetical protein ABR523_12550 [Desulfurivibrionaceae bacterium]